MQLLTAVVDLLLSFVSSPVTLLVLLLVVTLFVLGMVLKIAFFARLWSSLVDAFNKAILDVQNNAHAYIIIGVVALFFPQYAAIGALCYVVAKALGLKV